MNRSLLWLWIVASTATACGGETRQDATRSGTGGSDGAGSEAGSANATSTAGAGGSTPPATSGCAGVITFPDPGLEAAVREAALRRTGVLRFEHVAAMRGLEANGRDIRDLSGLECFHELRSLWLGETHISDLSPLSGLTLLILLRLDGNSVSDLTPLSGLPVLETLFLNDNNIRDLSPLLAIPGVGECHFEPRPDDLERCLAVFVENNPIDCTEQAATIAALADRAVFIQADCAESFP
jgi:Leucine-rich repeat (LRR) protein